MIKVYISKNAPDDPDPIYEEVDVNHVLFTDSKPGDGWGLAVAADPPAGYIEVRSVGGSDLSISLNSSSSVDIT
jgi:hypothetical protein